MPAPHGTFVPLISPPGYRTSQGGGRSWCARPGQALPRALPRLHDWGRVPLSLSQTAAIAFPVEKTYGPNHPRPSQEEGPGYGIARWHLGSFLNVIHRYLSGPGVHKHPIYFHSHSPAPPISIPTPTTPESICPVPGSLPTPLSLCMLPGPAHGTSLRKPHNRQQSLFPIWHLGGSKAHSHPAGGLLGQVALCSTWPGRGGDSNIDTWFWP